MKKKLLNACYLMLAIAGTVSAQSTADNYILKKHSTFAPADHYGQSISKWNNYLLVGGPDDDLRSDCQGRSQMTGGAVLYKDGVPFRKYEGSYFVTPDGGQQGWRAGHSVAISEDWLAIGGVNAMFSNSVIPYNQDGVVILAKKENYNGSFDFSPNFSTIRQISGGGVGFGNQNHFGSAVALSRNYLVIGAENATWQGVPCGLAFVYKLQNGVWSHLQTLVSPFPDVDGNFGAAVAISEDGTKIIVGAPETNSGNGSAHIWHLDGVNQNWILKANFYGNFGISDLKYGTSVDISNYDNNNKYAAIVGGSRAAYSDGLHSAVSILQLTTTGWKHEQTVFDSMVSDVAIEGNKAVYGSAFFLGGEGRIVELERKNLDPNFPWVTRATIGLQQSGARTGYSVDIANNFVVAGVFGYDYDDIKETCFNPSDFDETGGTVFYNFDNFNNTFYKNIRPYFRTDSYADVSSETNVVEKVLVSPNPADADDVVILSNEAVEEVLAIHPTGKSQKLVLNDNTADISQLETGIYILHIKTVSGTSVQKLAVK